MVTRPRWNKVLADLWGNRTRSLLVIASITVGLFAIGIIATIYIVIAQDMRASFMAVNPANVYVQTTLFDEDVLDTLRSVEGIGAVQGVRAARLRYIDREEQWKPIDLMAYPDLSNQNVNQLVVVEGTWPPQDGEIVIDMQKYKNTGLSIGDALRIERPSGKIRELTLVGVVQDVTLGAYSGGGGFFAAELEGFVTRDTLDLLEQPSPDMLSGVFVAASQGNDPAQVQAAAARISDALEAAGVDVGSISTRLSDDHPNSYLVNAIIGVLLLLGLLVVFLSGFLITNTLQALLSQQIQQIGIMKTIGARRFQIAGVYVILILAFGAIAYFIAVPLASLISFVLLRILAGALNFVLQGERVIWQVQVLQGALALIMPQLAAWLPIWSGTRVSVREALSGVRAEDTRQAKGDGAESERHAHGAHSKKRLRLPKFMTRPMLISLRNTFRRKGRLALTLITLTLGGAVFIATFNVQISLGKYTELISQYFLADVRVTLDRPYRMVEIEDMLKTLPGVSRVEGWAATQGEIIQEDGSTGENVDLLAPPVSSQLVEPEMVEGRWVEEGDQGAIVLNEIFMLRFPDLKVGDPILLKVNGDEIEWTVVGFFRFAGQNGGYSAYTTDETLMRLTETTNKAAMFQVVGDHVMTAREQDDLALRAEEYLEAAGIDVTDASTSYDLTSIISGGFSILTLVLLFLAGLTALVGSIGLAGTMSMNVLERTREIGVLRAIGASDKILMRMVLVEGMIIGSISYLAGALLSFPISKLMADGISLAVFGAPTGIGVSPLGFAIWLAAVVVLSLVASFVPARSAARLTIREVLAYE